MPDLHPRTADLVDRFAAALKQLARGINTMPCRPLASCHTAEEIDSWWLKFIQRQDGYVREVAGNALAEHAAGVKTSDGGQPE